jgi:hypothetical protein
LLLSALEQLQVGRKKTLLILNRPLAFNDVNYAAEKSVFCAAKFYSTLQRALVHIHYLTWWRAHKHHSIRFYLRAAKIKLQTGGH